METNPWEGLVGQVLIGSESFVESLKEYFRGDPREQREPRVFRRGGGWKDIVKAVESVKKEKWEDLCDRHGDWGRELAPYVARGEGG